ncbi:hypothetical protein C8R46DRAFT_881468, partial [Mycena filopes]
YFTLSGLKTNLGLLNTGITWAYIALICLVAFTSKFLACSVTAYAFGFKWREAGAIGSLMSCKGLVELIVLNIGLEANILDPRTFSMYQLNSSQALVLTFITTPLTILFYPAKYRTHHDGLIIAKQGDADRASSDPSRESTSDDEVKTKFSVVLEKIEQLPAVMTLTQLLQCNNPPPPSYASTLVEGKHPSALNRSPSPSTSRSRINVGVLRLIELTSRASVMLKSQDSVLLHNDPVISIFRTFCHLNHMLVSAALSVVGYDDFPGAIARHATEFGSQMVILPWSRGATVLEEEGEEEQTKSTRGAFDGLFHRTASQGQTGAVVYPDFIRQVFLHSPADVALFVDRGLTSTSTSTQSSSSEGSAVQQVFLPFMGGVDDRLALTFLVQLCMNSGVRATVVWIRRLGELDSDDNKPPPSPSVLTPAATIVQHLTALNADTVYSQHNTETRLASDTADNLLWDRLSLAARPNSSPSASARSRITFLREESSQPLHKIVQLVDQESTKQPSLIVMLGRSRRVSRAVELQRLISSKGNYIGASVSKAVGDVGAALIASGTSASLLVFQAAGARAT